MNKEVLIFGFLFVLLTLNINSYIEYQLKKQLDPPVLVKEDFEYHLLSVSISFIIIFALSAIINLYAHLFGLTIKFGIWVFILDAILLYINKEKFSRLIGSFNLIKNIKIRTGLIYSALKNNNLIKILLLCILVQAFCLIYRSFLPLTHSDNLDQYFFDSLQISRFENLKIIDFYRLGEGFRTDSLPSFFDSLLIQITDSWTLTRVVRIGTLSLIIFQGFEIMDSFKNSFIRQKILFTAAFLSLIDIWGSAISGKYDLYVCLLEMTAFHLAFLAIKQNKIKNRINLITFSICLASISIFSRLSSIALFSVLIITYLFILLSSKENVYMKIYLLVGSIAKVSILMMLLSAIGYLNYKFYNNPFYILSPPRILENIFPNAYYMHSYEKFVNDYNMRNIPTFIYPIIVFIYSSLGIEQIRFVLLKFSNLNIIFQSLFDLLSTIGPKKLMIAIDGFSPFSLLPFLSVRLKSFQFNINNTILFFLSIWLFVWTLSITYTRVALASSSLLVIFALSQIDMENIFKRTNYLYRFIFIYGIVTVLLFTAWSASNLADLPKVYKGLINKQYSRTELSREYISNIKITQNVDSILVPSEKFEDSWIALNSNNSNKPKLLITSHTELSHFMNHGIIISRPNLSEENKFYINSYPNEKYYIDSNNEIIKY